jgi:hypothetical protein
MRCSVLLEFAPSGSAGFGRNQNFPSLRETVLAFLLLTTSAKFKLFRSFCGSVFSVPQINLPNSPHRILQPRRRNHQDAGMIRPRERYFSAAYLSKGGEPSRTPSAGFTGKTHLMIQRQAPSPV